MGSSLGTFTLFDNKLNKLFGDDEKFMQGDNLLNMKLYGKENEVDKFFKFFTR